MRVKRKKKQNKSLPNPNNKVLGNYMDASGPVAVPMTNDYLFKALLQKNSNVLKAMVGSLLHRDVASIHDIRINNPITLGRSVKEKDIILDVSVLLNNDTQINLEMQVVNHHDWPERSTFYGARTFSRLEKGETYVSVRPTYQISYVNFSLFPNEPEFYATYKIKNIRTNQIFTDKFTIGIIDLTHIDLATEEDKTYNIDKWAKLFKSQTWEDLKMLATSDHNLIEAVETIYELTEDEMIRLQCEAREDRLRRERGDELLRKRLIKEKEELKAALAEKDEALAEKDEALAEKDEVLAEKDEALEKSKQRIKELEDLLKKTQ